jgi:hypothetical protein
MKWTRGFLILALFPSLSTSAFFEGTAAAQNRITISSPETLKTRLLKGSEADITELASDLQLIIPHWEYWQVTEDSPCTMFTSLEWKVVSLTHPGNQAVAVIYSLHCEHTYLVAFERTPTGSWRHLDTVPLWSKYNQPDISWESLISDGTKEMIADDCTVDSGTGIVQTDLIIFKLFSDRLQVILEAPKHEVYDVAPAPRAQQDQSQDSTFSFIQAGNGPATSMKQVLEKRVMRDHAKTLTQWWAYVWIPEIRRFRAIRTYPPARP